MAGNGLVFLLFGIQAVGNVAVRSAVVAQALDAVLLIPLIGHAVDFALQRDVPMEGGFKDTDMLCVRQNRLHGFDGF